MLGGNQSKDSQILHEKLLKIDTTQITTFEFQNCQFLSIPKDFESQFQGLGFNHFIIVSLSIQVSVLYFDTLKIGSSGSQVSFLKSQKSTKKAKIEIQNMLPISQSKARFVTSLFSQGLGLDMTLLCFHSIDSRYPALNSFLGFHNNSTIEIINRGDFIGDVELDFDHQKALNFSTFDLLTTNDHQSSIQLKVQYPCFTFVRSVPVNPTFVLLRVFYSSGHVDPDSHESTLELRKQLENLERCLHAMDLETEPIGGEAAKEFLEKIKTNGYLIEKKEVYNPLPCRNDLDFTDCVWNFLQSATTPQELSGFISCICDELEIGYQPYVNKRYNCWFARGIRDCLDLSKQETNKEKAVQLEQVQRTFESWITKPFEMITEMGIQVLKSEYVYQLVQYCSFADVQEFVNDEMGLDEQLEGLKKLHMVLEVVQLVSCNVLSISFDTLRLVVKEMLKYVKTATKNHVLIEIQLNPYSSLTMKVLESIKRFEPSEWGFMTDDLWFRLRKEEDDAIRWKSEYGYLHSLS